MKRSTILLVLCIFLTACAAPAEPAARQEADKPMYKNVRQPVVAGRFYPADADRLRRKIEYYLNRAEARASGSGAVAAIMVPHAGYDYSGAVAAAGFKRVAGRRTGTVVIVCNSHTARFDGVAIDGNDAWETPLGTVAVDRELADKLIAADKAIYYNSEAHAGDHTLEVQLPFLQTALAEGFKVVPILFGNTGGDGYAKLARALAASIGPDDLIVVSTDMSHYPSYGDANRIDRETLEIIRAADIERLDDYLDEVEEADVPGEQTVLCGIDGVKTAMEFYRLAGWDGIEILAYANSGDTEIGDRERVVGYGAAVFLKTADPASRAGQAAEKDESALNAEQQELLLDIAKRTVEAYVKNGKAPAFDVKDERLTRKEGAFVTLRKHGVLRGCIGRIIPPDKPLWQVVRDMAVSACSEDNRFTPVSKDELPEIEYEVSVLSAPRPVGDWREIELGKHGVIVRKGARAGVFLPQVADETGWDLDEFLAQLCAQKAGLPPDCYKEDKSVELQVFTAQVFGEAVRTTDYP